MSETGLYKKSCLAKRFLIMRRLSKTQLHRNRKQCDKTLFKLLQLLDALRFGVAVFGHSLAWNSGWDAGY